ncbi:MAG: hypothetical protein WCH77_06880 [Planctomycetota bacterium]
MVLATGFTMPVKGIRKYGEFIRNCGEFRMVLGSGLFHFGRTKSHCDLDFECFETISECRCGIGTEIAL